MLLAAAKDAKTERPSYDEADGSKESMEIGPAVAEKEGVDVEVKCDVVDSCAAELRFTLRQAGLEGGGTTAGGAVADRARAICILSR